MPISLYLFSPYNLVVLIKINSVKLYKNENEIIKTDNPIPKTAISKFVQ